MADDLSHWWGGDLSLTPSGDLATVSKINKDNQRIVRRLCTNGNTTGALIGEYWFHQEYGGSAPWYIGRNVDELLLAGLIRSQMYEEASVARNPEPDVVAVLNLDGSFIATIRYADAETGAVLPPLSFAIS